MDYSIFKKQEYWIGVAAGVAGLYLYQRYFQPKREGMTDNFDGVLVIFNRSSKSVVAGLANSKGVIANSQKASPQEIAPGKAREINISSIRIPESELRVKILTPHGTIFSPIKDNVINVQDGGKYLWTPK